MDIQHFVKLGLKRDVPQLIEPNMTNAIEIGCGNNPVPGARGYEVKVGVKAVAQHCLKVDSVFIAAANPATVLALLDELEAKDATIAFQQHEIRTLLGRLENANRAAAAGKGEAS